MLETWRVTNPLDESWPLIDSEACEGHRRLCPSKRRQRARRPGDRVPRDRNPLGAKRVQVSEATGIAPTRGSARILDDTLVHSGANMPNSSALYFQGTAAQSSGLGAAFGDGLRCVAGSIVRLATVANAGGASQVPGAGGTPISVRGLVASPGLRTYQVWYRNPAPFCTPSTFNRTNAVAVSWGI